VPDVCVWSIVTVCQLVVTWQASQLLVLAIWVEGLPVAVVPLWHEEHVPVAELWSKEVAVHVVVVWQSAQLLVLAICVEDFPVAVVPLWQE